MSPFSYPIIIAIDGPSASGKGTLAKRLAAHFDFAHLDTGLLYRAVGLTVLKSGQNFEDVKWVEEAALALKPDYIKNLGKEPALRSDAVSVAASKVASIPAVRAALLKLQQDFCQKPPYGKAGAVLDGRDIGTVIAPNAQVKIYVDASTEARAKRRFKELLGRGENATYASVLADMKERDARDASRSVAPAKPADDAVILDTTMMTVDQALTEAVRIAESKLN